MSAPKPVLRCGTYDDLLVNLRQAIKSESLSAVATRLGYRSKGSLSMYLSGRRVITRRAVAGFADVLAWSDLERAHAERLVLARSAPPPKAFSKRDVDRTLELNPDQFSALAKWYHMPLFFLLSAKTRFPGFDFLERKLRGKVTTPDLMRAVYALEKLGFVKRAGKTITTKIDPFLAFAPGVPNAHIQEHHRGMVQRAFEAVEEQPIGERKFRSLTFTMDPSRIKEAQKVVDEFVLEFEQHFGQQTWGEVCQMNVQLFWHTDLRV